MNYYIMQSSVKKNAVQVAFHVPIPDANNVVGVNWRTAVAQSRDTQSAVPFMDETEQAKLDNGEVVEQVATVEYSANDSDAAKLAAVTAFYTNNVGPFLTTLQDELQYWGLSGDVA